jgi:hypothetical protein
VAKPSALSTCGVAATVVQTTPGRAAVALASPGEGYALVLHKSGTLKIIEQATQQAVYQVGPFSACIGPFQLELQPCGTLLLKQGNGSSVWSSTSCCLGTGCYSSSLQEDGSLVVKDSTGVVVWSSAFSPTSQSGTRAPGAKLQLQSGGSVAVSCLRADSTLPFASLVSLNRQFTLTVGASGYSQLQRTSTASVLWSPASTAVSGTTTTLLCLANDSRMGMSSRGLYAGSLRTTWASKHSLPRAASRAGPYTTRISSRGCLDVLNNACQLVATTCAAPSSAMVIDHSSTASSTTVIDSTTFPPPLRARPQLRKPPPQPKVVLAQLPAPTSALPPGCTRPVLSAGSLCGGVNLCGMDAACALAHGICCEMGTVCVKESSFTWACAAARP